MERKWTLEELAEKSDMTKVYIHRIETGKAKKVSFEFICRIAKAFDLPVSILAEDFDMEAFQKIEDITKSDFFTEVLKLAHRKNLNNQ